MMRHLIFTGIILAAVFPYNAMAQSDLALAEQRLVSCAAYADWHPPYDRAENALLESCRNELKAYEQVCLAEGGRTKIECKLAASTLAFSIPKQDPIDRRFGECLLNEAKTPTGTIPMALLSLCRENREAFITSCQHREDAKQCEKDVQFLAQSAAMTGCLDRFKNDEMCQSMIFGNHQ